MVRLQLILSEAQRTPKRQGCVCVPAEKAFFAYHTTILEVSRFSRVEQKGRATPVEKDPRPPVRHESERVFKVLP